MPSKVIHLLVLNHSSMMSLAAVVDPLRAANRAAGKTLFEWSIISASGTAIELTCGIKIDCDGALDESARNNNGACDVFIVLGGFDPTKNLPKEYLPKLARVARGAGLVFAIESGTWVLARAGLLRDHRVTTHWEDLETLAYQYPELTVVADRFVIDRSIWTSGGASPTVDMMLTYLRRHSSQSLAMAVAQIFVYQGELAADRQQTDLAIRRLRRREPRLAAAIAQMHQALEKPLTIAELAHTLNISRRTLEKLFDEFVHESPASYYLHLRLQEARRMVLHSNLTLLDIAVRTGFGNASSFSRAFKHYFGTTALALRRPNTPTTQA